jgi:hypothetical protein
MSDNTREQAMQYQQIKQSGRASSLTCRMLRSVSVSVLAWVGLLGVSGCGLGGSAGSEGTAALLSGMPKCDPSLLHPRIAVGAAAGLPGKMIVYVDGVMACVDDASRVDQLMTQMEGRAVGSSLSLPAPTTLATPTR